jgi:putative SOS response-associated peptidase YedK
MDIQYIVRSGKRIIPRMCNRYVSPDQAEIERFWHIGRQNPSQWWKLAEVFPRAPGPFLRSERGEDGEPVTRLVVGQWGLVPWFAKTAKLTYSTNNARAEEVEAKASYKHPWQRGQRCIIPAWSFDEPCWESGKNVWWRFRRSDGTPWGLAGLWNTWIDKATGEIVESYTMLTVNADEHPIMRRMHKPDPKLPPDQQDKRSVISIEATDAEAWLTGNVDEARGLLRTPAVADIDGGPVR